MMIIMRKLAGSCAHRLAHSEESMARMAPGDELKLQLDPVGERAFGKSWEGLGQILRIADSEVSLMMHGGSVPLDITDGYQVLRIIITSHSNPGSHKSHVKFLTHRCKIQQVSAACANAI